MTKSLVLDKLKKVMDPELNVNIVDLGLVYDVKVKNEKLKTKSEKNGKKRSRSKKFKVWILMTLTSPGCPLAGMFEDLIAEGLGGIKDFDPVKDVEIELTFDPPWTEEMMTETVRVELGLD